MNIKETAKQFAKFFLIGIMNTFVDLFVLNVETIITGVKDGLGYSVQKSFSFIVAVTFSYFFNKHWTFQDQSKENEGKKFSQFMFVSIIGMFINVIVSSIVVTYLKQPINDMLQLSFLTDQIWVNLGALCGTAVGLFWNFIGYKIWVFKK